jgi:hypothetical protein
MKSFSLAPKFNEKVLSSFALKLIFIVNIVIVGEGCYSFVLEPYKAFL